MSPTAYVWDGSSWHQSHKSGKVKTGSFDFTFAPPGPAGDQNIYGNEVPGGVAEDGVALTQGTKFRASVAGQITKGRWWFGISPPSAAKMGIYRVSDFSQLAVKSFSVFDDVAWNELAFDSAVPILADTDYMAVGWTQNRYPFTSSYPYPKTSGDLVASGAYFDVSADISFPDTSTSLSFFCDLVFQRT